MNRILVDRIKIIKTLMKYWEVIPLDQTKYRKGDEDQVAHLIAQIRADKDHLLSMSQEQTGRVSYATKPEFKYDSARRTRTSFGRYVRKVLQLSDQVVSDRVLAQCAGQILGYTDISQHISIVSGEDLYNVYQDTSFPESCMTCVDYVQFYADNPDKVSMVRAEIPVDTGTLKARALVWNTDQGIKVMDRVYPSDNGWQVEALKNWGRSNGFIIGYNHEDKTDELTITMSNKCNMFPYLDTFKFATGKLGGKVVLRSTEKHHYDYVLQQTDGGPSRYSNDDEDGDDGRISCDHCGWRLYEDDAFWMERYDRYVCPRCYGHRYVCCEECDCDVARDHASEYNNVYYCSDCADKVCDVCVYCGILHDKDSLTKSAKGHSKLCDDCYDKYFAKCTSCEESIFTYGTQNTNEEFTCRACLTKLAAREKQHNQEINNGDMTVTLRQPYIDNNGWQRMEIDVTEFFKSIIEQQKQKEDDVTIDEIIGELNEYK